MNALALYKAETGLSHRALAERLGLTSVGHISEVVRGQRPVTVKMAKRLAELTGKEWRGLVDG